MIYRCVSCNACGEASDIMEEVGTTDDDGVWDGGSEVGCAECGDTDCLEEVG